MRTHLVVLTTLRTHVPQSAVAGVFSVVDIIGVLILVAIIQSRWPQPDEGARIRTTARSRAPVRECIQAALLMTASLPTMMAHLVCARRHAVSHVLRGITGVLVLIVILQRGFPQADEDLISSERAHRV